MQIIEIKNIKINNKIINLDINEKDKILILTDKEKENIKDFKEYKIEDSVFNYKNRNVFKMFDKEKENIYHSKVRVLSHFINKNKKIIDLFKEEINASTNLNNILKDEKLTHFIEKYNYYKNNKEETINNIIKEEKVDLKEAKKRYKLILQENKEKIIIKKYELKNQLIVEKVKEAAKYDNLNYKKEKEYHKYFFYNEEDIKEEISQLLKIFKINKNILNRNFDDLNNDAKTEIKILLLFAGKKDVVVLNQKIKEEMLEKIFNILKIKDTAFIYITDQQIKEKEFNKVIYLK